MFKVLGEGLENFNFNKLLNSKPVLIRQPFLQHSWNWNVALSWAEEQEIYHLSVVLNSLDDVQLHESESKEGKEDLLVAHKQTTRNPLVDCHSNHLSECKYSWLFFIELFCLINSFEEEGLERFE